MRIAHITDVEGNLPYLLSCVSLSPILSLSPDNELSFVDPADPSLHFVFGGDATDRRPHDLEVLALLTSFKRRHPARVHLVLGNRDLSKLRYAAELHPKELARPPGEIPPPHWDPAAPSLKEYLEAEGREDGRVSRLRYMLKHTLGCPFTFENRRQELGGASDEEVAASLAADVAPGGPLLALISLGCVAARLGDTLFVHGAIDGGSCGFVPGPNTRFELPSSPPPGRYEPDVDSWVAAMNSYLAAGLADYLARPLFDERRSTRGGEALLALQNRDAMWGRSVVSGCYADGGCIASEAAGERRAKLPEGGADPSKFRGVCADAEDARLREFLAASGVARLVVGHKPSADAPAVLAGALEVVSADTSYSDPGAEDGRGKAACSVLVDGGVLRVSGVLSTGEEHGYVLGGEGGDERVGRRAEEGGGWWVQTKLGGSPERYRLVRGGGRKWETKVVQYNTQA